MSDNISRQAVLNFPIRLDHYDEEHGNRDFVLGIESVMEYVESLPSAEPNPLCALADRECPFQGKEFVWCLTCPHISEEDRTLVKKAVEPKTGRWIFEERKRLDDETDEGPVYRVEKRWKCSVCGHDKGFGGKPSDKFCSECGADMRGGSDDTN